MTPDGQCYDSCPCPSCVTIRAARPDPPVPLAYMGCCGATVKLTRRLGGYDAEERHHDHCTRGGFLLPENKEKL